MVDVVVVLIGLLVVGTYFAVGACLAYAVNCDCVRRGDDDYEAYLAFWAWPLVLLVLGVLYLIRRSRSEGKS